MSLSDEIRRFAEEPDADLPLPAPPARRITRPGYMLMLGTSPNSAIVARLRVTADQLDETIAEIRAILRAESYIACSWYLGPSCRPDGVARLLAARGFVPSTEPPYEPQYTVMVLSKPPRSRPPAPGVEARLVTGYDEYVNAVRVGFAAAGESEENIAHHVAAAPAFWRQVDGAAKHTHIAFADGQVAGLGFVAPARVAMFLAGSAVLPAFRGRGVYRALVTSRWLSAVAAGKPALAIHAGAMSRPILERCGFERLCDLEVLADPTLATVATSG